MSLTSFRSRMIEAFRKRIYAYIVISGLVFALLFLQLFNLMIIQGSDYLQKSKLNMEDYIPIPASRGEMYDRTYTANGPNKILVSNRPSFNLSTVPAKFENRQQREKTLRRICNLLKISYEDLEDDLKGKNPWQRYIIKEDVPFDSIVLIASRSEFFPNIHYEDAPVRVYNFGPMFSHVLGYIGSISQQEYKSLKDSGYKYYQKVGKTGIEKQYDDSLRGTDGYVRRIVDVRNRTEGEEIGKEPVPGNNFVLTIDYEVQRSIYEAMGDQIGSAIVLKPATGEVIALVSKPDFDPNMLLSKNNADIFKELLNDPRRPFLTRPIMSMYPPASTFKLVTAISGLEEEKWKSSNSYYCSGKYVLQGYIDKDFYCYEAHGGSDLYRAIAKSCSAYFYNMGYKIGPTTILKYANLFGYSAKTEIDLPGEITGFIPSKKWKQKTFGQPWFDGDTINLAIGQGFTSVTPIEVTGLISAIVNGGTVYRPHVVKEIWKPDGSKIISESKREKLREIPLSTDTLNTVRTGMRMSVLEGTSQQLKGLKIPVAGKTGTAQTHSRRKDDESQHAWFAGFGPFDGDPQKAVVVVVMIEYGVTGASTAVPVAQQAFQKMISLGYFDDKQK
ncbi:MAG TPA: penicillin-binding protein 2 [Spirochaetota bacterium]